MKKILITNVYHVDILTSLNMLLEEFDKKFFYWPPDGEEPTYEECYNCRHDTFVIGGLKICRWVLPSVTLSVAYVA